MLKKIIIITACCLAIIAAFLSFAERIIFSYQKDGGLKHATRYYVPSSDKEIILIPMSHLNSKEFNQQLREYLEIKKDEGFVVFREGVMPSFHCTDTTLFLTTTEAEEMYGLSAAISEDSLATVTVLYKQRKIMGFVHDWSKPEIGTKLKSFYKDTNLVKFPFLDDCPENEIWADLTTGDLINRYEATCGPVSLSDYDFSIPIDAPYQRTPGDTTAYYKTEYASFPRNDLLRQKLLTSPWPKIVLVYGAAHIAQMKIFFDSDKTEYVKDKLFSIK